MNGEEPKTAFTKQVERRVNETKLDEEKRREYMLLKSFEMDARRAGIQQGIQQGYAKGSYQTKLETAKLMIAHSYPISEVCLMTGLSKEDIEKL